MEYLYFLQRGDDGPIKVGISTNVERRVRALQGGCAEPLRVLHSVPCVYLAPAGGVAYETEQAFLTANAAHRMVGEWLRPHPAVLESIDMVVQLSALNAQEAQR